jgi:glycosyltransferase involved in cell wall biosynthesis
MGNSMASSSKKQKPKALIFDPYLDTLGGGERYCLTVAKCLLDNGWNVDFAWDDADILDEAAKRFFLPTENINITGKKIESYSSFEKIFLFRKYKLCFWLSDGSVPMMLSNKNIIHFQVPFVRKIEQTNKVKIKLIDEVVCNSRFTKKFIDKSYGVKSDVLYPPIDTNSFSPEKKTKTIIGVGRFENTMQSKKQDILIKAFKKLFNLGIKDWELVLIGGSKEKEKDNKFIIKLKKMSEGYPIKFIVNAPFEVLKKYYAESSLFWHAAGYGIDENIYPWKVEHFGMTTVEAMASGCIPLAANKGGQKEIITQKAGFLFDTIDQLVELTKKLAENPQLLNKMSKTAVKESKKYSQEAFCRKFFNLVSAK